MQFKSVISIVVYYLFSVVTFSQSDTLNQKDSQGLKQGYWILYGKDFPEKGFCHSCKVEEGPYKDDRKTGMWIRYFGNGNIKVKGNFVNGRPVGYYETYYESGMLKETGYFAYGKNKGSYRIYYENGCIQMERYFDVNGKDSLPMYYYYPNCDTSISKYGTIEFKREKSPTDGTVDSAFWEDGTYKPRDSPNPSGSIVKTIDDTLKVGPRVSSDKYQKVYNSDHNLWMDGEFRDSKLWNGKLYIYNSDGILIKIEIWKNGMYHSDGQF